ncbi:MAG TPA: hypothetical protein PKD39_09690 [Chitinophagales bacterium]|nr:hypothetical protein [Chitinophagales bacterium]HNG72753.1 hypothetical protein [Chitinophagales bacterium]HNJ01699.1 hypothetical protein [Chitinophagales bacterium]
MKTTTKLFAITALFAMLLFSSCKEEKSVEPNDNSINPIEKFLNDSCTIDSTSIGSSRTLSSSIAIQFKSTQSGKITHLGLRSNIGKFKIALYDMPVDDNVLLALDSVNITNTSSFVYADITDINIVANKFYWIVYNNVDLTTGSAAQALDFNFNRIGAVLPITANNFIFDAMQYKKTTDINEFIDSEYYGYIFGVPAFKFIAD